MSTEDNTTTVENYHEYEEGGASGWYLDTFDEDGNLVNSEQISSDDEDDYYEDDY